MKEVRLHSKRGKATVTGVVGIVATVPCRGMEVTASITSGVRAPCVGSLASEMGARARQRWRPSPRGVGRGRTRARGQGGSGEPWLVPEAKGSGEPVLAPESW